MKLDDIMKLINAGFTKEEIQALEGGEEAQAEAQAETQAEAQALEGGEEEQAEAQAETQAEAQAEAQENVQAETQTQHASIDEAMNNALEQINKSADAFTKKLQSFNLANAEMKNVQQRTDEDIIASIVAPIKKGEK